MKWAVKIDQVYAFKSGHLVRLRPCKYSYHAFLLKGTSKKKKEQAKVEVAKVKKNKDKD